MYVIGWQNPQELWSGETILFFTPKHFSFPSTRSSTYTAPSWENGMLPGTAAARFLRRNWHSTYRAASSTSTELGTTSTKANNKVTRWTWPAGDRRQTRRSQPTLRHAWGWLGPQWRYWRNRIQGLVLQPKLSPTFSLRLNSPRENLMSSLSEIVTWQFSWSTSTTSSSATRADWQTRHYVCLVTLNKSQIAGFTGHLLQQRHEARERQHQGHSSTRCSRQYRSAGQPPNPSTSLVRS